MNLRKNGKMLPFLFFCLNFQNSHWAGLRTDSAGNALGCEIIFRNFNHNLHRADGNAFTAAVAELLINDKYSLGILRDSALLAGARTFSALDTGLGYRLAILADYNLNAGFCGIRDLVKCLGTGLRARKTCHAGGFVCYHQFFLRHCPISSLVVQ